MRAKVYYRNNIYRNNNESEEKKLFKLANYDITELGIFEYSLDTLFNDIKADLISKLPATTSEKLYFYVNKHFVQQNPESKIGIMGLVVPNCTCVLSDKPLTLETIISNIPMDLGSNAPFYTLEERDDLIILIDNEIFTKSAYAHLKFKPTSHHA